MKGLLLNRAIEQMAVEVSGQMDDLMWNIHTQDSIHPIDRHLLIDICLRKDAFDFILPSDEAVVAVAMHKTTSNDRDRYMTNDTE